jgi:precorrin-6B methylase 2
MNIPQSTSFTGAPARAMLGAMAQPGARPGVRRIVQALCDHAWSLGAVAIAAERGVLAAIAEQPAELAELARLAGLEQATMRACVDVLCGLGLARVEGGTVHGNEALRELGGAAGEKVLAADARATLGVIFGAAREAARPDGAVEGWRADDPVIVRAQAAVSEATSERMSALFGALPELATRLHAEGARLLDVGAGAGGLCVAFARAFPRLHVVGIDPSPTACAEARAAVARAGLHPRVEIHELLAEQLQERERYACAWVAQMFIPDATLPDALRATLDALEPGGMLVTGAIASLGDTLLAAISRLRSTVWGGGVRTASDVVAALEHAGFVEARSLSSLGGGAFLPIIARRP